MAINDRQWRLPNRAADNLREQSSRSMRSFEPETTMQKQAWAVWNGNLKQGGGSISTETGVLNRAPYGFNARFENGKGTNPEELIAAAHAACFSMALSMLLGEAGLTPSKIETHAQVTLDKLSEGYAITASHLRVSAVVPDADADKFAAIASKAKLGCPVSKLLNAKITMEATLAAA